MTTVEWVSDQLHPDVLVAIVAFWNSSVSAGPVEIQFGLCFNAWALADFIWFTPHYLTSVQSPAIRTTYCHSPFNSAGPAKLVWCVLHLPFCMVAHKTPFPIWRSGRPFGYTHFSLFDRG